MSCRWLFLNFCVLNPSFVRWISILINQSFSWFLGHSYPFTSYSLKSSTLIIYGANSLYEKYIIPPPTIIRKILTIHPKSVRCTKKSFSPLKSSLISVFLAMINTPLNEMHTPIINNTINNKIM